MIKKLTMAAALALAIGVSIGGCRERVRPGYGGGGTADYQKGYDDGRAGVRYGPIQWCVSDEYRRGYMMGSHDRTK